MDGFWIFIGCCVLADAYLFSLGYECFFFSAKTDEEKAVQKAVREKK